MNDNSIARVAYKALLKAQAKTKAELLAMASALESGIEETIITNLNTDGTGTSAQLSALTKTDRLSAIMEVYTEGNGIRSLSSVIDRSLYETPL